MWLCLQADLDGVQWVTWSQENQVRIQNLLRNDLRPIPSFDVPTAVPTMPAKVPAVISCRVLRFLDMFVMIGDQEALS